jgi:sec-independent protein translocase protein TatC
MALVPFPGSAAPDPARDESASPYSATSTSSSPFAGGGEDDDEPPEGRMTFLEHLDELRKRITHAVVALLVGFLIAFAFINRIVEFVYARFTDPGEAFFIWIKIAAIAGLLISSPYVMWQVWLFIAPGLYANEKKLAVPFVIFASGLFVSGAAFSHYVLFPLAWRFFASFSNEYIKFTPRVEPVFDLYVRLVLALGIIFQLPMLIFVLARFGIVTARFLMRNFKYAVLIMFVTAAIVTPDGSIVNQLVMAAPMIVLYIISIGVAWLFGKRRTADDEA